MEDECTSTTDEEAASLFPRMAPHLQTFTCKNMFGFVYASIHLQQYKDYVSLPFTILMTLQQSVVAERGREPGGFPSEKS